MYVVAAGVVCILSYCVQEEILYINHFAMKSLTVFVLSYLLYLPSVLAETEYSKKASWLGGLAVVGVLLVVVIYFKVKRQRSSDVCYYSPEAKNVDVDLTQNPRSSSPTSTPYQEKIEITIYEPVQLLV